MKKGNRATGQQANTNVHKIKIKIVDSPANLSLTAWCANAAGCNGGSVHVNGVRCGGTRNTCPGL